jgi:hypothetical protein
MLYEGIAHASSHPPTTPYRSAEPSILNRYIFCRSPPLGRLHATVTISIVDTAMPGVQEAISGTCFSWGE